MGGNEVNLRKAPFVKKIIFLFLIFIPTISFCQDSIHISGNTIYIDPYFKTIDPSKRLVENYTVLKNDTTKKVGNYSLKKLDGKIFIEGQYSNGTRSGVWNFYDYETNELFEQYDYTLKKDIFFKSDPAPIEVKSGSDFKFDSVDVQPHLPGQEGFFIMISDMKYPVLARGSGVSGVVTISLQLDTDGTFSVYHWEFSSQIISSGTQDGFKKSINDALKILPVYIPAIDKGKKVVVRFDGMEVKYNLTM